MTLHFSWSLNYERSPLGDPQRIYRDLLVLGCYQIKDSFLSTAFLSTLPRNKRQLAVLPLRLLFLMFGKSFASKVFGGVSLVVYAEKKINC